MSASVVPTDPVSVMAAIDGDARALDAASARLGRAIKEFAEAQRAYDSAVQGELVRIYNAAKEEGGRPPAEDVRKAQAHQRVDQDVYARFLSLQAQVDALKQYCRSRESILSARQSLLSALRAEARG
jgi:hypothetical protein